MPFAMVLLTPLCFAKCSNRTQQPNVKIRTNISADDSISNLIIQTFELPYLANMHFDSTSLVFYCSRAYDTTSLIQISRQENLIRGVYYEILPQYHRFVTDYSEASSKLIFFEGYSFSIDSATWNSIVDQAKVIFEEKEGLNKNLKYTDGATYALYYDGKSKKGNSNDEAPFVKFDKFLKAKFLDKYRQLRKPIMHKAK